MAPSMATWRSLAAFPQYQDILWRDVPTGSSIYNALEVVLERVSRMDYSSVRLHYSG